MKAIAIQIGNSNKERIEIDGNTFLKSVEIGKWNYIVTLTENDGSNNVWTGKCRTREAAAKWQYRPMVADFYLATNDGFDQYGYYGGTMKKSKEEYEAAKADFMARFPNAETTRIRSRHGRGPIVLRAAIPYTREIIKVER